MPNEPLLARALGILAKADSTPYEAERSSLVYGGYVLLARYLTAHPAPLGPDGRRRERRLVSDRRRAAHGPEPVPPAGTATGRRAGATGYAALDSDGTVAGALFDREI